jgi:hypothetical protein
MIATIKSDFPEGINAVIDIPTDKKVEVIIDNLIPHSLIPVPRDTIRFFVTTQSEGLYNRMILDHRYAFTYLLTQFPELLQLSNATKLVGCGSFIDPAPMIKKKFGVSMVMSNRNYLPGHTLRFELYKRRSEIKIPFDIYRSSWNPIWLEDTLPMAAWDDRKDKVRVMDCMYHIAIDTYRRQDHYSEKLVDALITKTIPIYWGCTNLSEYFNINGIFEVDTVSKIIYICNQLTPALYYDTLEAVNDNYNRGLRVYRYEDILKDAMLRAMNYVIGTIDNPFEDDTMQERQVFGIFEEGQTTLETDKQEEGGKKAETN